jgi:hypothetical protein
MGHEVAAAGDMNGGGCDDLAFTALRYDVGDHPDAGAVYVVFGKAAPFAAITAVSSLHGSSGFRVEGPRSEDELGAAIDGIGDLNDDGFDDLLVASSRASVGPNVSAGRSYVVYGRGAPFANPLPVAQLDGHNGFRLDGVEYPEHSGESVAGAGDINGDGVADLVIGARGTTEGNGSTYLVFGQPDVLMRDGFQSP